MYANRVQLEKGVLNASLYCNKYISYPKDTTTQLYFIVHQCFPTTEKVTHRSKHRNETKYR
eukprot:m.1651229 g.1651229  ORF g.1651229 m.1651229 type:complete len:61 (-) comp89726_c0_seq1:253-435(-)